MLLFGGPGVYDQDGLLHRPTELAHRLCRSLGKDPVLHRDRHRRVQVPDLFDQAPDLPGTRSTAGQRQVSVGEDGGKEARGVDAVLRGRPRQPQRRPDVLTDEVIGVHRLLPSERGGRGQRLGPHPVLLPLPDLQHDQPIRLGQCGQVQGGQRRHHLRPGRGREQGSHIQLRSTSG